MRSSSCRLPHSRRVAADLCSDKQVLCLPRAKRLEIRDEFDACPPGIIGQDRHNNVDHDSRVI